MKKMIIGIDLGGTNLKLGLFDQQLSIKYKKILQTSGFKDRQCLLDAIVSFINETERENGLQRGDIQGVGLGLPGPVDPTQGKVYFFPNIPGWRNVPVRQMLERRLKIPVLLDNDANVMALAEYRLGAAAGSRNAICLTLGTGVGGGLILDGRLYHGSNFAAGEVGHMPVNEEGPCCTCGGYACLESYIGNKRIMERVRKVFKKDIELEELSSMAARGNSKAKGIWKKVAGTLASSVTGLVNLLNPDVVVIGGGVANAGPILFNEVRKLVSCRAMAVQAGRVKIVKAKLGTDAGIIGAALLVLEKDVIYSR